MSNSVLSWINNVKAAVVTGTPTAVTGLGPSQVQGDQGCPATAWRVLGTTASLVADSGVTTTVWRAFCLARTNLTSSATVKWTISTPGGATTVLNASGGVALPGGVVPGYGQSVLVAPADVIGQKLQVDISDPANTDGFISVALVHAGPVWIPLTNIAFSSTLGRDDQVDEATTRGGQEFPILRWARRRWNLTFAGVRGTEVWPDTMELDRIGRMGSNVLFVFDPNSADVAKESVLGRWTPTSDISWPLQSADRRSYSGKIVERL